MHKAAAVTVGNTRVLAENLRPRHAELLANIGEGRSITEAAQHMQITEHTARTMARDLCEHFGQKSLLQVITHCAHIGVLDMRRIAALLLLALTITSATSDDTQARFRRSPRRPQLTRIRPRTTRGTLLDNLFSENA